MWWLIEPFTFVLTIARSIFAAIAKNFSRKLPLLITLNRTNAELHAEIFAIRFFLGIFESPMLPGVVSTDDGVAEG